MGTFDLGGQGGASFPFDTPGDSITGQILDLEEVQQTDMESGEPVVWPNGKPKMMYRLTLQTDLRDDPSDDGVRSIYLRGSRKSSSKSSLSAALDAVKRATGGTALQTGATYTHRYVADGVATRRGYNAPKMYEADYVPPQLNLDAPAPQVQTQRAPVYPQAPAPQQAQGVTPAVAQGGGEDPQAALLARLQTPQQVPAQVPAQAASKYTPDQLAALQAAGIDPATVGA